MVGAEQKYIEQEFVQRSVKNTDKNGLEQRITFHLVIEKAKMTDAEVAKLKDLLNKAAEDANTLLGW